jgi:hypothetical protein
MQNYEVVKTELTKIIKIILYAHSYIVSLMIIICSVYVWTLISTKNQKLIFN